MLKPRLGEVERTTSPAGHEFGTAPKVGYGAYTSPDITYGLGQRFAYLLLF